MVPRRKPIGCVFWPIAYFFSLPLPAPRRERVAAGRADALAARAGAAAGAAAGAEAGTACGVRTRQWRGRVSGGPPPLVSSLTAMGRGLVRCLTKNAPPLARG